jgi:hypothetical protein
MIDHGSKCNGQPCTCGAKACHNCGDTSRIKASASRAGVTRYFCHDNDRSCYNERRGAYFTDETPCNGNCLGGHSVVIADLLCPRHGLKGTHPEEAM